MLGMMFWSMEILDSWKMKTDKLDSRHKFVTSKGRHTGIMDVNYSSRGCYQIMVDVCANSVGDESEGSVVDYTVEIADTDSKGPSDNDLDSWKETHVTKRKDNKNHLSFIVYCSYARTAGHCLLHGCTPWHAGDKPKGNMSTHQEHKRDGLTVSATSA